MSDQERLFDVDGVDQALEKQVSDPDLIYLETGTILRAKKIPQMILTEIERRLKVPQVPRVEHPSEKGRFIENPDHPDYIRALKKYEEDRGFALTDVLLGLGTVLETLGPDQYAPEDDRWVDEISEFLPVDAIPDKPKGRYLAWLKFYQVQGGNDLQQIIAKVTGKMGVSEAEVGAAMSSFRDNQGRQTDLPSGHQA